jgi:hypothetical protein
MTMTNTKPVLLAVGQVKACGMGPLATNAKAQEMSHVTEKRKTVPSHGQLTGISTRESDTYQPARDISAFPKTRESQTSLRRGASMSMAEIKKELTLKQLQKLAPRDFHMFTKAGMPKKSS